MPGATIAESAADMAAALALLQGCATDTRQIAIEEAVKQGHGDLTSLIENADFAQGSQGWQSSTDFTAANGQVAEFWNKNFDYWQTVTGLPDGEYELTVQSFYRYGNINPALTAHNNGTERLNAVIYANDETLPVMSLYDESAASRYSQSPYSYPDNVSQANTAFNSYGLYKNVLRVKVSGGGQLRFGIRKASYAEGDWCCFDNWTLAYLGPLSAVGAPAAERPAAEGPTYDLGGHRVSQPGKGVYIKNGKKVRN